MTDKERGSVIMGLFGALAVAISVGMFFGPAFALLGLGTLFLVVAVLAI